MTPRNSGQAAKLPKGKVRAASRGRALVYLRLGRLEAALSDYDLALKFRPHSAYSLYARGLVLARLGRSGPAAEDHADALRLDATIAEYFHTIRLDR